MDVVYLVGRVIIVLRESPPMHTSRPALSFGNNVSSQDGTQLGGYFLLQWEHPVLTNHVVSSLSRPCSRVFPSVRLTAHDIIGSCHTTTWYFWGLSQFPSLPNTFTAQWVSQQYSKWQGVQPSNNEVRGTVANLDFNFQVSMTFRPTG